MYEYVEERKVGEITMSMVVIGRDQLGLGETADKKIWFFLVNPW